LVSSVESVLLVLAVVWVGVLLGFAGVLAALALGGLYERWFGDVAGREAESRARAERSLYGAALPRNVLVLPSAQVVELAAHRRDRVGSEVEA
jgi:hypothetical protein